VIGRRREPNQQKNNGAGDGGKAVQHVNARRVRGITGQKSRQFAAGQRAIHCTDDNASSGQKKNERFHWMFAPVNDDGVVMSFKNGLCALLRYAALADAIEDKPGIRRHH
jgi:hypothetical protein